ncbi:hypothetical protein ACI8AK_02570 [Geodermatophilus sp. SYSU D00867]
METPDQQLTALVERYGDHVERGATVVVPQGREIHLGDIEARSVVFRRDDGLYQVDRFDRGEQWFEMEAEALAEIELLIAERFGSSVHRHPDAWRFDLVQRADGRVEVRQAGRLRATFADLHGARAFSGFAALTPAELVATPPRVGYRGWVPPVDDETRALVDRLRHLRPLAVDEYRCEVPLDDVRNGPRLTRVGGVWHVWEGNDYSVPDPPTLMTTAVDVLEHHLRLRFAGEPTAGEPVGHLGRDGVVVARGAGVTTVLLRAVGGGVGRV